MRYPLTLLFFLCSLTLFAQNASFTRNRKPKTTAPAAPKQQTSAAARPQAKTKQQAAKPKQPSVSAPSGYENGHGYVDLGLSVKWATMNVGAKSPTGYGDYFAWGETYTKNRYDWRTYKWCSNGDWNGMTKYTYPDELDEGIWYSGSSFIGDEKTTLEPSDDAAHTNWGGSWRMPTITEQEELRENCTWTWTTLNGIKGYRVSSDLNGNSIFLPAAGYHYEGSFEGAGSYGIYWSSSLYMSGSNFAYRLYFNSDDVGSGNIYRSNGRTVRAVCP